jgi:enoyl-CoA hydratase
LTPEADPPIVARQQGRIGRLTVNRPKALNAIDHAMVRSLHGALDSWRNDLAIEAVIIEGAGGRAFCAGGDIRQVRDMALAGQHAEVEAFFADEYALNSAIAGYPKPYVALIDGVCMGGGMGLSIHGSARVVTDAAALAMPETGIGFFPDVGASYFLPRLPGNHGMFLALTGARVEGADAAGLGLATHYIARDRIAVLAEEMAQDGLAALDRAALPLLANSKPGHDEVVACFGADTVAGILERLAGLEGAPAQAALRTLRLRSPTAVLWAFELLRLGAGRALDQCLRAELALTRHAVRHPDFSEGVRAMVVDKDRNPRWSPARIEDVPLDGIRVLFRQLGSS